jgi:GAF domain-containing protein
MIAEGGQGRGRLLGSLASLAFAAQSAFDTRGLVNALAQHVLEIARADGFALFLLDYETGEMKGDAFERGERAPVGHARYAPRSNAFLERVLRREALVVETPTPATASENAIPWRDGSFESVIGVPIVVGTALLGVAVLGFRRSVTLTDRRRRALRYLADQIGLALDRLRARAEIETKTRQL